jgi:hypothetical protein
MRKVDNYRVSTGFPLVTSRMSEQIQLLPADLRDLVAIALSESLNEMSVEQSRLSVTAMEIVIICAVKDISGTSIVTSMGIYPSGIKINVIGAQIDASKPSLPVASISVKDELRIIIGFEGEGGRFQKVVAVTPELVNAMHGFCTQRLVHTQEGQAVVSGVRKILTALVRRIMRKTGSDA